MRDIVYGNYLTLLTKRVILAFLQGNDAKYLSKEKDGWALFDEVDLIWKRFNMIPFQSNTHQKTRAQ